MADYAKITNFATKDTLPSGNSGKIVKGTEIDDEFNAISNAIASKANTNSPTFTGTPSAPTALAGTNTSQLATTAFATTAAAAAFPSGGIIIWSGAVLAIPSGWYLCDGTNSTPDLRNKFVVGAGSTYAVGATGGSADAIVPSHSHTATSGGQSVSHTHDWSFSQVTSGSDNPNGGTNLWVTNSDADGGGGTKTISGTTAANSVDHTHTITVATAGVSATNANLPPYYALAYIQKA